MKRIITAINVQPVDFYAGDPPGTPIARVVISTSSGQFGGTLAISGSSKADFQPPVKNSDGSFGLRSAILITAIWAPIIYLTALDGHFANTLWAGPFMFSPTAAPVPIVTIAVVAHYTPYLNEPMGSFPPTVTAGQKVATLTAARSDGQPFAGTWIFAKDTNSVVLNYGGAYGLSTNADGTGNLFIADPTKLGAQYPSIEHVQVIADQP